MIAKKCISTKKRQEPDTVEPSPAITKRIEQKQVEERVAIGATVVHETIRREGEDELKRSGSALAWSGLAAGLSMGFSLAAEALSVAYLPDQPWRVIAGAEIGEIPRSSLFPHTARQHCWRSFLMAAWALRWWMSEG